MNIRKILHIVRHPKKAYREHVMMEKKIFRRNGDDTDNTYYVIRCDLPECGLFAIYMYVLDHIAFAMDKGYIPVLDLEQYSCLYKEENAVNGQTDPWRYFFEPISDVTVEDCKKKKNVILSAIKFPHYKAIYYYANKENNVLPSGERIEELHAIVRDYIRIIPELQTSLDEKAQVLKGFNKVLGVHVRGTDMFTEGKQHPIPTGKTKDFSTIDQIIEKHGIDGIFLCTDTDSTVKIFKEKYGDKVITTAAVRQKDDSGTGIHKDASLGGRENHKYLLGVEVITDMYLLSKCDCLMCGPSNVPFVAIINNGNKYESVYYYA